MSTRDLFFVSLGCLVDVLESASAFALWPVASPEEGEKLCRIRFVLSSLLT
jgi:hypothetical protein